MKHFILLIYALTMLLALPTAAQYKSQCFTMSGIDRFESVKVGATVTDCDSIIPISNSQQISGLFISGYASLQDRHDCCIRITLQDSQGFEYLVYEVYPILADSLNMQFSKVSLESSVLNRVVAQSIKVEAFRSSVSIDSIYYVYNNLPPNRFLQISEATREAQCDYIVHTINADTSKTWLAGMTSVSLMTYEEKKDMFGGQVPLLYGFDYYKDGVFLMPGYERELINLNQKSNTQYVDEWDWRNRHGQNWFPPVRNQGACGSCWAFSAVGTFEPYINLYYNQHLDIDLSEQELVSCSTTNGCGGGFNSSGLSYIKSHGIVEENCFNYTASNNNCENKCETPSDIMSFGAYDPYYGSNEDSVKRRLFKAPLSFAVDSWHHAIVLVGFKTIHSGDSYYSQNPYSMTPIADDSPLVGHSAWLIRNSWGTNWGMNGYGYVALPLSGTHGINSINGSVSSQLFDDNDIVCEDADGDGLYYWGVGPKPLSCPSWVPDEEDGDDSDYTKGPIDEYGFLQYIIPDQMDTIYIDQNTEYASIDFTTPMHIIFSNNSTLTVSIHLTCY